MRGWWEVQSCTSHQPHPACAVPRVCAIRLSPSTVVVGIPKRQRGGEVAVARRVTPGDDQPDLFSLDVARENTNRLSSYAWPDPARFPLNRSGATVRRTVWPDLATSRQPVVAVGYSSIGELVELVADREAALPRGKPGEVQLKVLLGSEPFATTRSFAAPELAFTQEVEDYWYARGISLRRSAKVVAARQALLDGRVHARAVVGYPRLHAKLFVGDAAASVGSSNLTASGLESQLEVNARFDRTDDPDRYAELRQIADNLWDVGRDWTDELLTLLDGLLQVVGWREALGRACGELLEGDWVSDELGELTGHRLWPSQLVGIAQAMWIIERVGGVLVADATGSGKTRMGAHLVRAVRERLLTTGRVRDGLTVLVCPPSVEDTWRREALASGLSINTVSHGLLSRRAPEGERIERHQVRGAQLLAVDEAHNFLNPTSERTRTIRDNAADHVLLFTATPISKGATDLLDLVALLGPDNFGDATHATLRRLEGRRRVVATLTDQEIAQLREEIQRFTLRRTKTQINRMVDLAPDDYRHPVTDRVCRYPAHRPEVYATGETVDDEAAAAAIRQVAGQLTGIAQLTRTLAVPQTLRQRLTDETWLRFQLRATAGLVAHHVLAALRSSRAALYEHLHGTDAAIDRFALSSRPKAHSTGDVVGGLTQLAEAGPPTCHLDVDLPDWLTDPDAWAARCREELDRYAAIGAALERIGDARERAKAALLADLSERHPRVLAFDRHLTTLAAVRDLLTDADTEVVIATGQAKSARSKVQRLFAPDHEESGAAIALCSDAMSEGLNLQGASAMVHLDLPTTLRVAEQRVGRVDRMDSRHDAIEAWWPRDGAAFATRANERLASRLEESASLLGANLPVPDLRAAAGADDGVSDGVEPDAAVAGGEVAGDDRIVDPAEVHRDLEARLAAPADDLADALEPVRALVEGPTALLTAEEYARARAVSSRVLARVAPVRATSTWAFLAVRSTAHGAPRWMLVRPDGRPRCETDLGRVAAALRAALRDDPEDRELDEAAADRLTDCLAIAAREELGLLPRRSQRALDQMRQVTQAWARGLQEQAEELTAQRWLALRDLARPAGDAQHGDPFVVAERWLELVAPRLEAHRTATRGRRYALLRDITKGLERDPLPLAEVETAMSGLPQATPLAERVSACILGVPGAG